MARVDRALARGDAAPATPEGAAPRDLALIEPLGEFDRISVGFPGVVVDGVTKTAPNLHELWQGFDLGKALAEGSRRPVRVLNDAGVQGYGVIEGKGLEMVLTLGTGLGCGLYLDGNTCRTSSSRTIRSATARPTRSTSARRRSRRSARRSGTSACSA